MKRLHPSLKAIEQQKKILTEKRKKRLDQVKRRALTVEKMYERNYVNCSRKLKPFKTLGVHLRYLFRGSTDSSILYFADLLADDSSHVRIVACRILSKLGDRVIQVRGQILTALDDGDPEVRALACSMIRFFEDFSPEEFEAIKRCVLDRQVNVRTAILESIQVLGSKMSPIAQTVHFLIELPFYYNLYPVIGSLGEVSLPVIPRMIDLFLEGDHAAVTCIDEAIKKIALVSDVAADRACSDLLELFLTDSIELDHRSYRTTAKIINLCNVIIDVMVDIEATSKMENTVALLSMLILAEKDESNTRAFNLMLSKLGI